MINRPPSSPSTALVGRARAPSAGLLASRLGWNLLDSGALYRLLALSARNHGVDLTNETRWKPSPRIWMCSLLPPKPVASSRSSLRVKMWTRAIRTEDVGAGASQVAALPAVRDALLQRQRVFREAPGLVADGRDMGTVVFADAQLKIYLTASAKERASRRYRQLLGKGETANLASLLDEIVARDERDMNRSVAPLKPADDAILIDSTQMSIEEVLESVQTMARERNLLG
ncbi:(d)CMP kinase [Halopseudomonas pachastrellae]|nr:(d)CMP kinase [Halopseudomonas pachastrellae]